MTWQQFLTEKVLGDVWHNRENVWTLPSTNRTFTTRNDLMDLYEAIKKNGKWREFCDLSASKDYFYVDSLSDDYAEWTEWLFCLNGKGYEERCKIVAKFYGWEEKA